MLVSVCGIGSIGRFSLYVIKVGDFVFFVGNDGEVDLGVGDVFDVVDLVFVVIEGVGREIDEFDVVFGEFRFEVGYFIEFGGVDGCVVFGVGEEDDLVVVNEFMEVNGIFGGFGLEVGGNGV